MKETEGAAAGPRRRSGGPGFSAALGRAICARVASGESQVAICAEPGMPSRTTLWRWTRTMPKFAAALQAARAAGGVERANGRLSGFCQATADEIFARLCEGESLSAICGDPAMPCFSTVYYWRRQFPDFAEAMRAAREIQAERFCDLGWEIARAIAPENAYATHVQLAQLRWTAAVLAPTRYGRLKPAEPDAPTEERHLLIRTFKAEPGDDGRMRVVSYTPRAAGGVERRIESEGRETGMGQEPEPPSGG